MSLTLKFKCVTHYIPMSHTPHSDVSHIYISSASYICVKDITLSNSDVSHNTFVTESCVTLCSVWDIEISMSHTLHSDVSHIYVLGWDTDIRCITHHSCIGLFPGGRFLILIKRMEWATEGWEADYKNLKKNRPGPDGRDASHWYGRLRVQKLTLSMLNCAHAPGQSFHE